MEFNMIEYLSIVASIVSVIIGGFAIWLSVTFYKMANKSSEDLKQASNTIDKTVNRLEAIFEKLYSDTFTMVKDTVTDMRQHIWKNPIDKTENDTLFEQTVQSKTNALKKEFSNQISELVSKQSGTDIKLNEVHTKLNNMIDQLISKSRKVEKETKEKLTADLVLQTIIELNKKGIKATLIRIVDELKENTIEEVAEIIFKLGNEGVVKWGKGGKQIGISGLDEIIIIKK